jgi:hypothetical protein
MDGDLLVFYQYRCWHCQRWSRSRVKQLARFLVCFDCSLAEDRSSRSPPGLPKAEVYYEYRCRLCQRVCAGRWPADPDGERKLRARITRGRCLDCFNPSRRPPEPAGARPPQAQGSASEGAPCLHGTPVQHCAYCRPGRYAYRPWRKSGLE